MSVKLERLEHKFAIEISNVIKEEIKDDRIQFVTITSVSITKDLSFAKVYFTLLDDKDKDNVLKVLNKAGSFIQHELCNRIDIRKMPSLRFVYDESIEYSNNIEKIIESINENE